MLNLLPPIKPETWAYIAGLFDGEGSLSLAVHGGHQLYPSAKIFLGNSHEPTIDNLVGLFGGCKSQINSRQSRENNRKPFWSWALQKTDESLYFLEGVLPYLVIKSERASIMLEFLRLESTGSVGRHKTERDLIRAYTLLAKWEKVIC